MNDFDPVVILGGGLAGLTAATFLRRHNIPVRVYEASKNLAGLARSERDDEGFTYDCGAHFITNRLAAALGVSATCRHMPRYGETVWHNGRCYSFPFGLMRSIRYASSAAWAKVKGIAATRASFLPLFARNQKGARMIPPRSNPTTTKIKTDASSLRRLVRI